jgi:hypothetical protein
MTVATLSIIGALLLGAFVNIVWGGALKKYLERRGVSPFLTLTTAGGSYGPAATLLALIIAFVLVGATQSYTRARTAVQTEAAVVDNFFETAEYLPDPGRRRLQRAAVCYARAVAGPEWITMAKGSGELSKVPSNWTGTGHNGIRRNFKALGPDNSLFSALTAADGKRGDARRARLTEARPKVPGIVMGFILAAIGIIIVFFAVTSPRLSPFHLLGVSLTALTLLAAVFLIRSLDRPFTGPLRIEPTEMRTTAAQDGQDFIDRYGAIRLRCDANGNPTGSRPS